MSMLNQSRLKSVLLVVVCIAVLVYVGTMLAGCLRDPHKMRVAANIGNLTAVKEIVSRNPYAVNSSDDFFPRNTTPLHWAAQGNHYDVAKYLLDHGAKVNAANQDGDTPLHYAAVCGNGRLVELLLSRDAKPDVVNEGNETPLSRAMGENNPGAAKVLIKAGADDPPELYVAAALGDVDTLLRELKRNLKLINKPDKRKMTPLHYAAINNRAEAVEALLSEGADPQPGDEYGFTPLYYAAEAGNMEVAEKLIDSGADANAQSDYGLAPLHGAAGNNQAEMILFLVGHGADVNIRTENNETPLNRAITMANITQSSNQKAIRALRDCYKDSDESAAESSSGR